MRRLFLLRHAKADPAGAGVADHARPLNARGAAAAGRVGAYLTRHGLVPDHVVCSTAQRTRETWAEVAKALPAAPDVVFDRRIYDGDMDGILDTVRETAADAEAVMVVGHNPSLHHLALMLIASGDVEQRERLREKLPTCGLVVIDFKVDGWDEVRSHGGRLDRFISPRGLHGDTA